MPANCPCCSQPVASQAQDTFKCDGCKARVHIACVGLSSDDAVRLTRSKARSTAIKTYCTPCENNIDKFSKLSDLITNLQANLESKISDLVAKMEKLERSNITTELKPDLYESIVNESMERINRSKNIIIFNVPESADPQSQKQDDESVVKEIIDVLQVSDTTSPISVQRFGKNFNRKPRILKVTFPNQDQARQILRCKKRLANTRFSTYSIQDDKTPSQQEHLRFVRNELKRRMEEENEKDLTIKYIKGVPTIISSKN